MSYCEELTKLNANFSSILEDFKDKDVIGKSEKLQHQFKFEDFNSNYTDMMFNSDNDKSYSANKCSFNNLAYKQIFGFSTNDINDFYDPRPNSFIKKLDFTSVQTESKQDNESEIPNKMKKRKRFHKKLTKDPKDNRRFRLERKKPIKK